MFKSISFYFLLFVILVYWMFSTRELYNYNINNENVNLVYSTYEYITHTGEFKKEQITMDEIKEYMIDNKFNNDAIETIKNSWINVYAIKGEIWSDYYFRLNNTIYLYWKWKQLELKEKTLLHELIHTIMYKNNKIMLESTFWLKQLIKNNKDAIEIWTQNKQEIIRIQKEKGTDYINKIANDKKRNVIVNNWNILVLNDYSSKGSNYEINHFINSNDTLADNGWKVQELITYAFTQLDNDKRNNFTDKWYVEVCNSLFNNCNK